MHYVLILLKLIKAGLIYDLLDTNFADVFSLQMNQVYQTSIISRFGNVRLYIKKLGGEAEIQQVKLNR